MNTHNNNNSGIQGQLLDVTVVAWNNSRDTKVFSGHKRYVRLEYASSKFRTNTCSGGSRNSTFQETYQITLIEGLRELEIAVWSSKSFIGRDELIGTGRIQLDKVLSHGYDDSFWPIQTENLRAAGEVKLIMHYSGASKQHEHSACTSYAHPPSPPYGLPPLYAQPPPPCAYPPAGGGYPYAPPSRPPPYYASHGAGYLPPPPSMTSTYPPAAYPPPAQYPQYNQAYPPQPAGQPPYYAPPGPYPGGYPPPY